MPATWQVLSRLRAGFNLLGGCYGIHYQAESLDQDIENLKRKIVPG